MGLGGIAAGVGLAASAASLGNTLSNAVDGGPTSGNTLKSFGVSGGPGGSGNFSPVTGFDITTPGFGDSLSLGPDGLLHGSLTETSPFFTGNPNAGVVPLSDISADFSNIRESANQSFNTLLQNLTGIKQPNTSFDLSGLPGASLLAPLNDIETARQKAVSDIEGTLADRGISGSSFGTSALANANATFGQAASDAALKLSQSLYGDQLSALDFMSKQNQNRANLAQSELAREIQQLEIESGAGVNVSSALTRNAATLTALNAQVAQGNAAGVTSALNALPGQVGSLTGAVGNLFNNNDGASNPSSSGVGVTTNGSGQSQQPEPLTGFLPGAADSLNSPTDQPAFTGN